MEAWSFKASLQCSAGREVACLQMDLAAARLSRCARASPKEESHRSMCQCQLQRARPVRAPMHHAAQDAHARRIS